MKLDEVNWAGTRSNRDNHMIPCPLLSTTHAVDAEWSNLKYLLEKYFISRKCIDSIEMVSRTILLMEILW